MKRYLFGISLCIAAILSLFSCKKPVNSAVAVERLEIIDPSTASTFKIEQGDSYQIRCDIAPAAAIYSASLTWESDNPECVDVSPTGLITAYAQGDAVITVSCDGHQSKLTVEVTPIQVTSFDVKSTDLFMSADDSPQLEVRTVVEPAKASPASLVWQFFGDMAASVPIDESKCPLKLTFVKGQATLVLKENVAFEDGTDYFIKVTAPGLDDQALVRVKVCKHRFKVWAENVKDGAEDGHTFILRDKDGNSPIMYSGQPSIFAVDNKSSHKATVDEFEVEVADNSVVTSVDKKLGTTVSTQSGVTFIPHDGSGEGATALTIKYSPSGESKTISRSFFISRNLQQFPSSLYVKRVSTGARVSANEEISNRTTADFELSDTRFVGKWTSSDPSVAEIANGDYAVRNTVRARAIGKSEITVTDESGNSVSFVVSVVKPQFPDELYIINEATGLELNGYVIALGGSNAKLKFRLSDSEYIASWSVKQPDLATVDYETGSSVTVTLKTPYSSMQFVTIVAEDEAGKNKREFTIKSVVDLSKCNIYQRNPSDNTVTGKADVFEAYYQGSLTPNCTQTFYVTDKSKNVIKVYDNYGYSVNIKNCSSSNLASAASASINLGGQGYFTFSRGPYGGCCDVVVSNELSSKTLKFKTKINLDQSGWNLYEYHNGWKLITKGSKRDAWLSINDSASAFEDYTFAWAYGTGTDALKYALYYPTSADGITDVSNVTIYVKNSNSTDEISKYFGKTLLSFANKYGKLKVLPNYYSDSEATWKMPLWATLNYDF